MILESATIFQFEKTNRTRKKVARVIMDTKAGSVFRLDLDCSMIFPSVAIDIFYSKSARGARMEGHGMSVIGKARVCVATVFHL